MRLGFLAAFSPSSVACSHFLRVIRLSPRKEQSTMAILSQIQHMSSLSYGLLVLAAYIVIDRRHARVPMQRCFQLER